MNVYLTPSFYAHILNSVLIVVALVILYKNYSKISRLEPYKLLVIILLFTLVISVHGLSHLGLERVYGFNPILIL
jgi:hypothetical protein